MRHSPVPPWRKETRLEQCTGCSFFNSPYTPFSDSVCFVAFRQACIVADIVILACQDQRVVVIQVHIPDDGKVRTGIPFHVHFALGRGPGQSRVSTVPEGGSIQEDQGILLFVLPLLLIIKDFEVSSNLVSERLRGRQRIRLNVRVGPTVSSLGLAFVAQDLFPGRFYIPVCAKTVVAKTFVSFNFCGV